MDVYCLKRVSSNRYIDRAAGDVRYSRSLISLLIRSANFGLICLSAYLYSTLPRLLLFWMSTQAVRTRSRGLGLDSIISSFMRDLGLDPGEV